MALYLKDPEVDRLARELAGLERVTITEAVARALTERRQRLLDAREAKRRKVEARLQRIWALPIRDPRDPDEILYDEDGLPKA
jgi:antitoxin VapB